MPMTAALDGGDERLLHECTQIDQCPEAGGGERPRRKTESPPEIEALPQAAAMRLRGQSACDPVPHLRWRCYFRNFRGPRRKALLPIRNQPGKATVARHALFDGHAVR